MHRLKTSRRSSSFTIAFAILLFVASLASEDEVCTNRDDDSSSACDGSSAVSDSPSWCRLYLAARPNSSNRSHSRQYGIYTVKHLPRGTPLTPTSGDILLHLIDVDHLLNNNNTQQSSQLSKWYQHGFLVDAITSGYGGNYEGKGRVVSVLPGVGMLAASSSSSSSAAATNSNDRNSGRNSNDRNNRPNVWAKIPTTDEANHPRNYSPLAGSFALNYNLTYVVNHPMGIEGGGEVLVDREGWFRRQALGLNNESENDDSSSESDSDGNMNIQQLHQSGICLEGNIHLSISTSTGRGAFASRLLKKGSTVAPVPVLSLPREELRYLRTQEWKKVDKWRIENNGSRGGGDEVILPPGMKWRHQLMLNYCFGHSNSSVLLFPYGPLVNYVNHAPSSEPGGEGGVTANIGIRWSEKLNKANDLDPRTMSPSELWKRPSPEGLVMEYFALRDIQPNEEILIAYGSVWSKAWAKHEKQWKDDPNNKKIDGANAGGHGNDYSPAYIMEDVISNLRTAEEQLLFPYPKNIFTACFYSYRRDESKGGATSTTKWTLNEATPWTMSRGLFDMMNLRPCKVISREPAKDRFTSEYNDRQGPPSGKMFYTAIIQNRPDLPENEQIPKGEKHIVSGIPREAFRFVDKSYTSDEHLEGAFRQNIGLEETGVFPEAWLDLS